MRPHNGETNMPLSKLLSFKKDADSMEKKLAEIRNTNVFDSLKKFKLNCKVHHSQFDTLKEQGNQNQTEAYTDRQKFVNNDEIYRKLLKLNF